MYVKGLAVLHKSLQKIHSTLDNKKMSEDWVESRDSIVSGKDNNVNYNWKWELRGVVTKDYVVFCDDDGDVSLVICLAKDDKGKVTIKAANQNNTNDASYGAKFLTVKGAVTWKKLSPTDCLLPEGAVFADRKHHGQFEKIYVGRHSESKILGAIYTPDDNNWCLRTHDNKNFHVKDDLEVLCAE